MITLLIADENVLALNHLKSVIDDLELRRIYIGGIKCFDNPAALLEFVKKNPNRADIVFLDLGFHRNGEVQIARELHRLQDRLQLIFTSRKGFFQSEIYEVPHIYYLDKPIRPQQVSTVMEKAVGNLIADRSLTLPIVTRRRLEFVKMHEIVYLEKQLRMIHIQTMHKRYSLYGRFEDLIEYFTDEFLRCHQSYIVNLEWVERLENSMFFLRGQDPIPISQRRLSYARHRAEEYFRERK